MHAFLQAIVLRIARALFPDREFKGRRRRRSTSSQAADATDGTDGTDGTDVLEPVPEAVLFVLYEGVGESSLFGPTLENGFAEMSFVAIRGQLPFQSEKV
jgi:hypothetical protein